MKELKLKSLRGRVICQPIEELKSGILHLPQVKTERAGTLVRCRVTSSGIPDVCEGDIVHCKAELGYRVPMSSQRIYLMEDILLIENGN